MVIDEFVVTAESSPRTSSYAFVNKLAGLYRALGFSGAPDHSGCRIAVANWARRISIFWRLSEECKDASWSRNFHTMKPKNETVGLAHRLVVETD